MPYIEESRRRDIELGDSPATAGELNYRFTQDLIDYIMTKGLSYQTCNDIVGALDNCKDEFQRRIQHPYEDRKINLNGDVYGSLGLSSVPEMPSEQG